MKKLILCTLLYSLMAPVFAKKVSDCDIKIGVTSDKVVKCISKPDYKTVDFDGNEAWVYEKLSKFQSSNSSNFGLENLKSKNNGFVMVLKFDEESKVISYSYRIREVQEK